MYFDLSLVVCRRNEIFCRLSGILLVDVIGMEANSNVELRKELRKKNINLLVVKNSFNSVAVASAPNIGAAAFLSHYPISGSAQGGVIRRFLAPPVCAKGQ